MINTAALNCRMAAGAKADKVCQRISPFPVAAEFAPRLNVVNVHRPTYDTLSNAAILAFVAVALAGGILLFVPSGAAPFVMAALPVAMVCAFLPCGGASIGAEVTAVLAALYDVAANANGFAALQTDKVFVAVLGLALAATKSNRPGPCKAGRMNREDLAALLTRNIRAILSRLVLARRRTIELVISMGIALSGKGKAAIATGVSADCHTGIIPYIATVANEVCRYDL